MKNIYFNVFIRRFFTAAITLAMFSPAALSQTTPNQPVSRNDEIEKLIERIENGILPTESVNSASPSSFKARLDYYHVPGLSIAVINNYKIDWLKGYGVKDFNTRAPVTTDTLFQAASISKSISAMIGLKLVQEGKISLDENINNKLISWRIPENEFTAQSKVTLGNLLSHTAGITVHGFLGYQVGEKIPDILQILNGEQPANNDPIRADTTPATAYRYSGGGFIVAMVAMMDIEKKPFPLIAKEKVLEPLKMKNSTFNQSLPANLLRKAASGHLINGDVVEGKFHIYPELSAAGLWTTPEDLAKFAIEIQLSLQGHSNKVLSKSSILRMCNPVMGNAGIGLFSEKDGNAIYLLNTRSNVGFKAEIIFNKDKGYGAVIMINSDNRQIINEVVHSIAREYKWEGFSS